MDYNIKTLIRVSMKTLIHSSGKELLTSDLLMCFLFLRTRTTTDKINKMMQRAKLTGEVSVTEGELDRMLKKSSEIIKNTTFQ